MKARKVKEFPLGCITLRIVHAIRGPMLRQVDMILKSRRSA